MYCNTCKQNKNLECYNFYIRKNKKIYYVSCNECRNKRKEKEEERKKIMKEEYLKRKENNIVECECGTIYIAFREYHIFRHLNTINHKKLVQ